MKLPAFQFYPGDWKKDPGVQALTFHDRGVWFEILCLMHEAEQRGRLTLNGAAMPEDALARLLGLDKQILTTTLTTILTYGVASVEPDTGILFSRRMVRDERLRQIRTEAGKKGGNPRLLNQKKTTGDNQISTPSSSFSSSTSIKGESTDSLALDGASSRPKPAAAVISWNPEAGFSGITQADRDLWSTAYPAVNLDRSIAAASDWLKRNPHKRKKQHGRFLSSWLSREQERGGHVPANASASRPKFAGIQEDIDIPT